MMFCVLWIIGIFAVCSNIPTAFGQKDNDASEIFAYKYNMVCDKLLNRIARELRKKTSHGKKEVLKYNTPIKLPNGAQLKGIDVYNVSRIVRRTMQNCAGKPGDPFHVQIPFEIPRLQLSAFFYPKGKKAFGIGWFFGQIKGVLEIKFYKNGKFADMAGSKIYDIRAPSTSEKAVEIFDVASEEAHRKFLTEEINKLQLDKKKLLSKLTEIYINKLKPVLESIDWKEWYQKIRKF